MQDKHDFILNQIKNNGLNGMPFEFVIAQLCVLNNKPFVEVKNLLSDLLKSKELELNPAGEIVIVNLANVRPVREEKVFVNENAFNGFDKKGKNLKGKNKNGKPAYVKPVKISSMTNVEGKIQGTRGSFAFFVPFNSEFEDVFISSSNLNGALSGDTVAIEVYKNKRGLEGQVVRILQRGATTVVGKIEFTANNSAFVVADDVKLGKDIFVQKSKTLNANDGDKVVVKIIKYSQDGKSPEGEVVEVLGPPNKIETEILSVIRSYELYEEFPKKVVEHASKMPTEIKKADYPRRLDLTKELLFTIDGEDARDLDDAVSLTYTDKGLRKLGVHIADVGEYVKLNSPIDNEAFKRATSVYFPNLVLPMLPKNLSNGICSLNEMVDRLALSVFIIFDEKANMVDYEIYESVIKSKKRFTYTEVDKILTNDEEILSKNQTFAETLKEMNHLSKQLFGLREKRGAIDFDLPEVKISLNETGDVLNVSKRDRNDSHKLIESFMIAANEAVALHFNKNKIPFVYRIHEKPDSEKMATFSQFVKSFGIVPGFNPENVVPKDIQKIISSIEDENIKYVVNKVCLRSLRKAKYFEENLGHFGLASSFYSHFTSPIRRYPDLTIHRIIKMYLNNQLTQNKLTETKQFVVVSSKVSSEREVIAERVERDVDDLYKTFYTQHHLGEEFEGRINSVMPYGVYVELDNTVEGLVRLEDLPADQYKHYELEHCLRGFKHEFKIGQHVKVKPVRADVIAREIDFILA